MAVNDVSYIKRTRDYYRAQGYTTDYLWAHFDTTPFTRLKNPLSESRIGVITTTMPDTEAGRADRRVWSTASEPIPRSMYTEELSWHKSMTHTDDVASFLPLAQLNKLQEEGVIGSVASRFHSVPTEYSQRNTIEKDAPQVLARCQQDEVDIAILVPL
ncbi:MAG: hypothetical protein IIC59_14975 [Proteobacteria bacterium]|nr:hypothetical protein [Pseudomonadota bacterium]